MSLKILDGFFGEAGAHVVNVQGEFAGGEASALVLFFGGSFAGGGEDLGGFFAADDADAVVVGDEDVAGVDELSGADEGEVDGADGFFDGALRPDGFGPDGELHFGEFAGVADSGVGDESDSAAGADGGGDEFAAVGVVAGGGRGDDGEVAGLQLLDGDMHCPVVSGGGGDGDGGAGDSGAGKERPEPGGEHSPAVLGFVDGGDSALGDPGDDAGVGPGNVSDDDSGH